MDNQVQEIKALLVEIRDDQRAAARATIKGLLDLKVAIENVGKTIHRVSQDKDKPSQDGLPW